MTKPDAERLALQAPKQLDMGGWSKEILRRRLVDHLLGNVPRKER